jgi:bacterioferritin (cytochrome b1)
LSLETDAVKRLNDAIKLAAEKSDNGSRALFEKVLLRRESALDWHESELHAAGEVGKEAYLAEQIHD